ncbi:SRPBCC domain-containing protein [Sphingobacterium wenxiniae]|uniref:Uncharacterized conserved protein YndB, AHSA1/START domain n=1 Tax=Sphingobacterium wenxiniae TaxID=683125 RepID=A0A1I6UHQ3_9SPHI|nr:SRPBCC domain-containing protein [Sphingobacterium wenxiniae]SFT00938.1 Uncharacterized conserved protein YndB, AHSA1/START domain [Sphingobacterium wenxiniae]
MKDFKKYYIIPTDPEDVYKALTIEITARLWTGDEVQIDAREGGEFSLWDGAIQGNFITLEPYTKIVQEWYFGEQEERSIVTFKFHEHKKGTSLEIQQTNIPDEAFEDIVEGWEDTYIASLIEFYEEE